MSVTEAALIALEHIAREALYKYLSNLLDELELEEFYTYLPDKR